MSEPKRYPKPKYCLCNKGHNLVEVYNELRNCYEWDCPICIARQKEINERRGWVETNLSKMMYGKKPLQEIR
jgi:hypothetical protein